MRPIRSAILLSTVLALGAACGGDDGGMVGDGDGDGDGDCDGDGDGDSTVSFALESGGAPAADLDIVIHNADGSVFASAKTDSNGELTTSANAGGMVTIINGQVLRTITNVQDGDVFAFDLAPAPDTTAAGQIVVNFDDNEPNGATNYIALMPCAIPEGQGSTTDPAVDITIDVTEDCKGDDGMVDILAVAVGDQGAVAFSFIKDLAVTAGNMTQADFPAWDTGLDPATVNVANLPADTFMGNPQLDPRATVLNVSSDKTYGRAGLLVDGSADFEYEADFADLLSYSVSFFQVSGTLGSNRSISARIAETDTIDQDVADMLSQVTDVTVDTADLARPIINYTGPTGDAALGFFTYGEDAAQVTWTVLHEPGTSAQLPALPSELASSWAPAAAGDISAEISVFENSAAAGYADVRQTGSATGGFDFAGEGSRSERSTSFVIPASATAGAALLERSRSRSRVYAGY